MWWCGDWIDFVFFNMCCCEGVGVCLYKLVVELLLDLIGLCILVDFFLCSKWIVFIFFCCFEFGSDFCIFSFFLVKYVGWLIILGFFWIIVDICGCWWVDVGYWGIYWVCWNMDILYIVFFVCGLGGMNWGWIIFLEG